MKSKIFAKIQRFFQMGGKGRAGDEKQDDMQLGEGKALIDAIQLPEDNPWYFAGEKAKEANLLTKVHFATGPRLMQSPESRKRWAWNSTEQPYKPEGGGGNGSVEVWNEHHRLGKDQSVPIEIQMLQEHESAKLKNSKLAQAMFSDTDPAMSIMTQEVPTESETMEIPAGLNLHEDLEQPPTR